MRDGRSYELLAAIIESEEASLRHWDTCKICGPAPQCMEGRALMAMHIEATLAAKIYVDMVRKGSLFV